MSMRKGPSPNLSTSYPACQVDVKAMETAHRIGQTRPVKVYRLLCGASVEEEMLARRKEIKPTPVNHRLPLLLLFAAA